MLAEVRVLTLPLGKTVSLLTSHTEKGMVGLPFRGIVVSVGIIGKVAEDDI